MTPGSSDLASAAVIDQRQHRTEDQQRRTGIGASVARATAFRRSQAMPSTPVRKRPRERYTAFW